MFIVSTNLSTSSSVRSEMWARPYVAPDGAGGVVITVNYRHCAPPALSFQTIDFDGN